MKKVKGLLKVCEVRVCRRTGAHENHARRNVTSYIVMADPSLKYLFN